MASARSIAVFMLPALAAGATLHSEQASLIRQEKQMQLTAGGEMLLIQGANKEMLRGDEDYSCFAFIEGTAGQSSCPDGHIQIQAANFCRDAALRECPNGSCLQRGPDEAMTILDEKKHDAYPLHCFKGEDGKYGYNPGSREPTNAKGKPICHHPKFINGTASAPTASDCGKPGYEHVLSEEECGTAIACLDRAPNDVDRQILDDKMQETRPLGCHVAPDGRVQFNNKITGTPAGPVQDGAYPLCHWKGVSNSAVDTSSAADNSES